MRAGRPSPGFQPRKGGTCHTKTPIKNVRAGGGVMNALPPNASPAACVQDAERPGPWRITACASVAARSGARPSAQGAQRLGQPAYFTLAEMPNGVAGARVTGASGATGHGGTLACAGVAASNSPLKAARSANPVARRGVNASGNNMPCGVQLASAADAVRPPPTAARAANGAPGERPNPQGRRRRTPEAAGVTSGAGCEGFA